MINEFSSLILIGIGIGFLPSFIWLLFWLHEDKHPEPVKSLIKAFFAGMLAVPCAIILQYIVIWSLELDMKTLAIENLIGFNLILVVILWATAEEILKFFACAEISLIRSDDDEPIDPVIYLITSALGFAAVENILFILSPLFEGNILEAIISTNMRFMGATLLHLVASGLIGLSIGFVFYKDKKTKIFAIILGLCGAIALHTIFNLIIIKAQVYTFTAFVLVWVLVIGLILTIEKIKLIKK